MSEIDWDVELRKIEREFDGLPPTPSAGELRARKAAERREKQRKEERIAALGAWGRLVLVAALAAALYWWPYLRACGPGLFAFLGAESMVVAGGLWVVAFTWRHRMARTHALGMLVVIAGLALILAQVLPRVGYARTDPAHPPQWWCTSGP